MRKRFNDQQIDLLKSAFEACDKDNSGVISKEELHFACEKSGYMITDGQLDFIFLTIDKDKSGEIDFEEFLEFIYICQFSQTDIQQAKLIFEGFDADGGGSIDKAELYQAFQKLEVNVTIEQVNQAFEVLDKDQSGSLDFNEFLTLFHMMKKNGQGGV